MLRLYINATALTLPLFIAFIIFMRLLGFTQLPHPALTGIENCMGIPCWMHIDARQNTPDELRAALIAYGYRTPDNFHYTAPADSNLCDLVFSQSVIDGEDRISAIQLSNCGDLRLGDVWQILDVPELINYDCSLNSWALWANNSVAVVFSGELIPHSLVTQVAIFNFVHFNGTPMGVQWYGFTTLWRYNQLEGNIWDC